MVNIIKTAIITIVISFISGVLLDYYKNLAPRILCTIKNTVPIDMNGKKFFAYIITVVNVSKKTIHELNLNVQSSQSNLKITDAKITKGLKFDSSVKDNILDVYMPFLSKDDKFSVTMYVENPQAVHNKPVIVIRSPENFKRIDSAGQKGILALLLSIPESIKQAVLNITKSSKKSATDKREDFTRAIDKSSDAEYGINNGNRKLGKAKKAMIITVPIILLVIVGFLGKSYFKGLPANTSNSTVNTALPNHSTGSKGSASEDTIKSKNSSESGGYKDTNRATESSTRNTSKNSSIRGTTRDTNSSSSTKSSGTSSENKGTSSGAYSQNRGTNTTIENSSGNTSNNTSTRSSSENTVTNTPSGASSENKSTNASSGSSSENKDTNSSSGSSSGSSTGTSTGNASN
ncbi:hypothetical protein CPAST_c31120 [Clostridium pasteurianum DSM 525 = ATCC 6013]|uniref:Uncharacterized protein n=1 Tax=Clostridium pasteurianum DSM 525 = ATCC 6013 TaxID=1262449 RepID=A0A0H3JA24_CLOPA|nr:hypothetical protein [Clostridium pasteurianum]AJA49178.1 hypothetical protein CPAST_c31120 [Clostridium pasteurianum DSM 525 = ATCC 6013]AJA53166.1 hypothetical protein CLPA_c31120 [Clostridium pasteurianum DSM 525 = ATCC 6013]AOZ76361.1 hypothetical protein AQ983_15095 [Clostridium pasteurianum DSM 525 = ATCC 6013]AOZ80158.1 hypothetical protein AQ984_15090 [Clostridium pasteurianum]ELP59109.1 hypothetical protein F502_11506 [Clostridium pasteurianum DSM 525 = ATCC 6013]